MFFEDLFEGQSFCPIAKAIVSKDGVLSFVQADPIGGYRKIYEGYQSGLQSPFGTDEYVPGGLTTVMMTSFVLDSLSWSAGPIERGGSQTFKRKMPTGAVISCKIDVMDVNPRRYPPRGDGKATFKVTLTVAEKVVAFGTREFLIARRG